MSVPESPILLETVGDEYVGVSRIMVVIWYGSSAAGDQAEIRDRESNNILWAGLTDSTSTYLGANFSGFNVGANGFKCSRLDSGRILVYLAQY